MTSLEQLEKWVAGESIHNVEEDQCCPDFSCCTQSLLASEEERKMFLNAFINHQQDIMDSMLMIFLEALIKNKFPNKNIYVAGQAEVPEI